MTPTSKPNDLQFTLTPSPIHALNPSATWDAVIIDEADLLSRWAGVSVALVHSQMGMRASSDGKIHIDRRQLENLFGHFEGDKYRTAIFFALAHEFGHAVQFKVLGETEMRTRHRIELEAHADVLSGVWLGIRLFQEQPHIPEDLCDAAFQLKSGTLDYPTAAQRAELVQIGFENALMLCVLEQFMKDHDNYRELPDGLLFFDFKDTYEKAQEILAKGGATR